MNVISCPRLFLNPTFLKSGLRKARLVICDFVVQLFAVCTVVAGNIIVFYYCHHDVDVSVALRALGQERAASTAQTISEKNVPVRLRFT